MSLLVLMYHRARAGRFGNAPDMLDRHFRCIAERFNVVFPGETCASDRLNVCLTFDDAYFDFYATVFPLLQKHDLKAVVAVPVSFILKQVGTPAAERISLGVEDAHAEPDRGGFCTWPELEELAATPQVRLAAHGYTHVRLDGAEANLPLEIDAPATLLRTHLGRPIDSFVFPFGRYSRKALTQATARYRHVFRIGDAMNRNWDQRLLYRVDADQMETPESLFASSRLALYRTRFLWNRLRGR